MSDESMWWSKSVEQHRSADCMHVCGGGWELEVAVTRGSRSFRKALRQRVLVIRDGTRARTCGDGWAGVLLPNPFADARSSCSCSCNTQVGAPSNKHNKTLARAAWPRHTSVDLFPSKVPKGPYNKGEKEKDEGEVRGCSGGCLQGVASSGVVTTLSGCA